jgi:hypothetical protein
MTRAYVFDLLIQIKHFYCPTRFLPDPKYSVGYFSFLFSMRFRILLSEGLVIPRYDEI